MKSSRLVELLAWYLAWFSEIIFLERPEIDIYQRSLPKLEEKNTAIISCRDNSFLICQPVLKRAVTQELGNPFYPFRSVPDILFRMAIHEVRHQIQDRLGPVLISEASLNTLSKYCMGFRGKLILSDEEQKIQKIPYREWLKVFAETIKDRDEGANYTEQGLKKEIDAHLVCEVASKIWEDSGDINRVVKLLLVGCEPGAISKIILYMK